MPIFGGAIAKLVLGNLQVTASVFANNAATDAGVGVSGAIYLNQNGGTAALTNVTLASLIPLNLNNVTLTGNTADRDNDGTGDGGGIFRDNSIVQIQNSIIAGNFDTPGSAAINAGNPLPTGSGGFACAAGDQRGIARPQGSTCDMGAFEMVLRSLYLPLIQR